MPHLQELLDDLAKSWDLPALGQPTRLETAKRQIALQLGDTKPRTPSAYDLMETYEVLANLPRTNEAFRNLSNRHLKRTPWVLLEAPRQGLACLADDQQLLQIYLSELKQRLLEPAIVVLAIVFLRHYPSTTRYFGQLRETLWRLVDQLSSPKGKKLHYRAMRYGLFREDGADVFGKILSDAADPEQVIADAGFDADTSQRGFVRAAAKTMLAQLSKDLFVGSVTIDRLHRTLQFLTLETGTGAELRFPTLRAETAESLLRPFTGQAPEPALQERIKGFLLDRFSDPRTHSGNWQAVHEDARMVMMRWLVHGTLEDFFRVVREGSQHDRDADRMWPYREAFWGAYLRKGVIADAWVVLGEQIAHRSRKFLASHAESYARFGRGTGVSAHHAALIMRIGNLVITEWNFSGKYRVWKEGKASAPPFYRRRYTKGELTRDPDFEKSHHGAEYGSWQSTLASHIGDWTGVRITHQEYMPK